APAPAGLKVPRFRLTAALVGRKAPLAPRPPCSHPATEFADRWRARQRPLPSRRTRSLPIHVWSRKTGAATSATAEELLALDLWFPKENVYRKQTRLRLLAPART